MREAATNLEFERAAKLCDDIKRLREMDLMEGRRPLTELLDELSRQNASVKETTTATTELLACDA